MKLALEALDNLMYWDNGKSDYDEAREAITALREALAEQPAQQEAQIVRWNCPCGNKYTFHGFTEAPAQRTWVGLPESAFTGMTLQQVSAMKYSELICKEKNT